MDGFSTTGLSPGSHSVHTQIGDDVGGSLRMPRCPVESGPGDTPSAGSTHCRGQCRLRPI